MARVQKEEKLPEGTIITNGMSSIDYYDSYKILLNTDDSIEEIAEKALSMPNWVNTALQIRHYLVVKPFGLKSGKFDNRTNRSKAVSIIEKNENEIVMGQDDKHLYYRLSFMKKALEEGTTVYLNTVVKFNNIGGKIYFLPVRLGHKLVVRSVLRKLASAETA